jgi:MFS transporter, OFA family, oxalate/formate antiporter
VSEQRKGVLALIGGSVAIFWHGAFIFGFPGVMSQDWQVKFQVGRGEIGNVVFFTLAAVGLLMFFVGRWQDRYGTRCMVTIGAVIAGLNVVFVAWADSLWMVYLWAFVMGGASCFVYIPALTAVQRWYPLRRGLMSGIVNSVFGISGAVMAPVFRHMLETLGYSAMNVYLGVAALVFGVAAAQFTVAPSNPGPLVPTGSGNPAPVADNSLTVAEGIRSRGFWFLWFTWALQGAAGISMVTLSTSFGLSRGLSLEAAVAILTVFNLTNGLSRFVSGFVSDMAGRNSTMSATFLLAAVSYFLLPHVNGFGWWIGLAAVIGFAFGTLFSVSAPLAMDCFGVTHYGAIFGLVFTAYGFVAGAIGPSLSGYMLDFTGGNYTAVFGYLGVFCLLSAVLIQGVRPPRRKEALSR